jgi:hypothetical protein
VDRIRLTGPAATNIIVSTFSRNGTVARVNILRRVKTSKGWANVALKRNAKQRIQWPSGGRFLIEWRENGKRLRASAGDTPAEALEAQKRKRLELDAKDSGLEISGLDEEDQSLPLQKAVEAFLKDIKTFANPSPTKNTNTSSNFLPNTSPPNPTPRLSLPRT